MWVKAFTFKGESKSDMELVKEIDYDWTPRLSIYRNRQYKAVEVVLRVFFQHIPGVS